MKGYLGYFGTPTKPWGQRKRMDWHKARAICEEAIAKNPDVTIRAGLVEDWKWTSGVIYENGEYVYNYVFGYSDWATPIVDVDGEEIECWTYDKPEGWTENLPDWWEEKDGANDGGI